MSKVQPKKNQSVKFSHKVYKVSMDITTREPKLLDEVQKFILKVLKWKRLDLRTLASMCPFPGKITVEAIKSMETGYGLGLVNMTNSDNPDIFLTSTGEHYANKDSVDTTNVIQKFTVFLDPQTFIPLKCFVSTLMDPLDQKTDFTEPECIEDIEIDKGYLTELLQGHKKHKINSMASVIDYQIYKSELVDIAVEFTFSKLRDGSFKEKLMHGNDDVGYALSYLLDDTNEKNLPEKVLALKKCRTDALLGFNFNELEIEQSTIDDIKHTEVKKQIISDSEHPELLISLINGAEKSVFISSGWVNSNVIRHSSKLIIAIEKALYRGVKFDLMFVGDKNSLEPNKIEAIDFLDSLAQKHSTELNIHKQDSNWHRKQVVVDSKISICGSYNWLSNQGYRSSEASILIESEKIAAKFLEEFSRFKVEQNEQGSNVFQFTRSITATTFNCDHCNKDKTSKTKVLWNHDDGQQSLICNACYGQLSAKLKAA